MSKTKIRLNNAKQQPQICLYVAEFSHLLKKVLQTSSYSSCTYTIDKKILKRKSDETYSFYSLYFEVLIRKPTTILPDSFLRK
jgi:hypothetical protein